MLDKIYDIVVRSYGEPFLDNLKLSIKKTDLKENIIILFVDSDKEELYNILISGIKIKNDDSEYVVSIANCMEIN